MTMAFNSNGAVSFEYLIDSSIELVNEINETLKIISDELSNG